VIEAVTLALVAGAAALAAGWLARVIEETALVASGPVAGEPVLAWSAGAIPGRPAASPVGVGMAAVAVGAVLTWAVGAAPVLPALVVLAGIGLVLAPVDVRTHRLPDAITLPAYPVLAVLLLFGGVSAAARAAEGGLVAFGVVALLVALTPSGFGFGDVKLMGLLGAALAWFGWSMLLRGLMAGFLIGGLCATGLLLTGHAGRRDHLAFGPFLLAGALAAVVLDNR
jgi:leader peptidase (prepilin peptidase)/N-methyltransferase